MPLVRCRACIARSRQIYRVCAEPVGYPDTDFRCGAPSCLEPGLVWLRGPEAIDYTQRSRACFPVSGTQNVLKVRVRPAPGLAS
jgi:hypothetical protein